MAVIGQSLAHCHVPSEPGAAMGMKRHLFLPGHLITEEVSVRKASVSLCILVAGSPDSVGRSPSRSLSCVLSKGLRNEVPEEKKFQYQVRKRN